MCLCLDPEACTRCSPPMGDLTVRKISHSVTVNLDTDGTPLWMGERMVEVAPGEWMTQAAADFSRVTAELAAAIDEATLS